MKALRPEPLGEGGKLGCRAAGEEARHIAVQVLREVEPELGVEIQGGFAFERYAAAPEYVRDPGRCVNGPFARASGSLDGPAPLDEPGLLTHVDFLAAADQAEDDAPVGDALGELI